MIKTIFFIAFQYIAPQHFISRVAGYLANCRCALIKNNLISLFIKHFNVDMSEAACEDATAFETFNTFFTRALKPGARAICTEENTIACPADGAISEIGMIINDQLLQAKGRSYTLLELLGGNQTHANLFHNGRFATVYLSPKDYHRVHMPVTGTLREMIFIPGKLFSVNQTTANHVPNVFACNERVVCLFDTAVGTMAVILVGAMVVASIETVWAGVVAPQRRTVQHTHYSASDIPQIILHKGDELGRFLLGSTAIVLFQENANAWDGSLYAQVAVRMGQSMGTLSI